MIRKLHHWRTNVEMLGFSTNKEFEEYIDGFLTGDLPESIWIGHRDKIPENVIKNSTEYEKGGIRCIASWYEVGKGHVNYVSVDQTWKDIQNLLGEPVWYAFWQGKISHEIEIKIYPFKNL